LPEDPLTSKQGYFAGQTLLRHLAKRVEHHGLDKALCEKLIDYYRSAMSDWPAALVDGSLASKRELAMQALEHAVQTDDTALLAKLVSARVPLDKPLLGSALPLEVALGKSLNHAAQALIDAGAPVTPGILAALHDPMPLAIVEALLARGAEPTPRAVVACAECGSTESAQATVRAYVARRGDFARVFANAKRERLNALARDLSEVRSGKLIHHLGEKGLQRYIDALKEFAPSA